MAQGQATSSQERLIDRSTLRPEGSVLLALVKLQGRCLVQYVDYRLRYREHVITIDPLIYSKGISSCRHLPVPRRNPPTSPP